MNFQDLIKIENPETYLDIALRKARLKAEQIKGKNIKNRLVKARNIELMRINTACGSLQSYFEKILISFPSIDSLPVFYNELVRTTLDYVSLKKSLGGVNWGIKRILKLNTDYQRKISRTQDFNVINKTKGEFCGRLSSVVKQLGPELAYLEDARKTMKGFPTVKTSIPTICIFGFPNVGKTTLLYKLTGSKPEINSYAFTTKNINVSYANVDNKKVQFVDTPGSLDRMNKMNTIEKQAYLVLKHVADIVVYVFDLTESYPLADQEKLYYSLRKDFVKDKNIISYLSKTDLVDDDKKINEFAKKYNAKKNIENLKKDIQKLI